MKCKRNIAVISLVAVLCLLLAVPSLMAAGQRDQQVESDYSSKHLSFNIAGTWIASWGGYSVEETCIYTAILTPINLSGTKLAYLGYGPNPSLWNPLFPETRSAGLAVGELVRTGRNTYKFTVISHAAEAPPTEYEGRGQITYFFTWTGTARLIDGNTFVKEDATFSLYSAKDIYDPDGNLIIPNQDADRDGFPDVGTVPLVSMPWDAVFKRVGVGNPH